MDENYSSDTPPSPSGEEGGESETITVPPGMLPNGMEANPGDVLEFRVVGKTPEGGIQCEYNHGGMEDGMEKEKPWKTDLRNSMAAGNSAGGEEGM
jgi:hypothetical protein